MRSHALLLLLLLGLPLDGWLLDFGGGQDDDLPPCVATWALDSSLVPGPSLRFVEYGFIDTPLAAGTQFAWFVGGTEGPRIFLNLVAVPSSPVDPARSPSLEVRLFDEGEPSGGDPVGGAAPTPLEICPDHRHCRDLGRSFRVSPDSRSSGVRGSAGFAPARRSRPR